MNETIKIKLEQGANIPLYHTQLATGVDLVVNKIIKAFKGEKEINGSKLKKMQDGFKTRGYIKLRAFERILFGTGLSVALPEGIEMQIRSRSGMALKKGLVVMNQPGTIDPDYRGEIGVILYNSTPHLSTVLLDERVAQGVFNKVVIPTFELVDALDETDRGAGGFGSTNKTN